MSDKFGAFGALVAEKIKQDKEETRKKGFALIKKAIESCSDDPETLAIRIAKDPKYDIFYQNVCNDDIYDFPYSLCYDDWLQLCNYLQSNPEMFHQPVGTDGKVKCYLKYDENLSQIQIRFRYF